MKKKKKKIPNYKFVIYCRVGTPEQMSPQDDEDKRMELLKTTKKH